MTTDNDTVDRLAAAFTAQLREDITTDEWNEMVATNADNGTGAWCASHDYCDANMTMLAAFEETMGREPTWLAFPNENDERDAADFALWNAAWDKAKASWTPITDDEEE